MKTSPFGRSQIRQREGERLVAYLDSVGIPTIGVGHTGRSSPPNVHLGMAITAAQADAYLATDLVPVEKIIHGCLTVKLTQNQFDALASLVFNIGTLGFQGSTVLRKLNKGLYQEAADAMMMWDYPLALKARRISERAQFLSTKQPS